MFHIPCLYPASKSPEPFDLSRLFELGILKAGHFDVVKATDEEGKLRVGIQYSITKLGQDVHSDVSYSEGCAHPYDVESVRKQSNHTLDQSRRFDRHQVER